MARLPRFVLPGHPQHIIQRGNNRNVIFCADDDYRFYLERLHESAVKHQCSIHAYVLMTNHVHLLVTPETKNGISKMMQSLGRCYVQYFNCTYRRTGTLWEGRYKASLIDTESYFLICMKYIELNPVRAKCLVKHPSEYPWSRYHCNATGKYDRLIAHHDLYLRMGSDEINRQLAYKEFVAEQLSEGMLSEIRETANKAWVLGDDGYKNEVEQMLKRRARPKKRGGDRKSVGYRKFDRV